MSLLNQILHLFEVAVTDTLDVVEVAIDFVGYTFDTLLDWLSDPMVKLMLVWSVVILLALYL